MLTWMLYVTVVSLVLSLSALAAERAARLAHSSTRWIWALAIVLSLAIPTVIASVSIQLPSILSPAVSQQVIALRAATSARLSPSLWMPANAQAMSGWHSLDPQLLRAWLAVSVAMGAGLICSGAHLMWIKRQWTRGTLAGAAVFIAPDAGPAVVGLLRPCIVVPRWLTVSSEVQVSAVMAHEQSHVAAGDPRLLTGALLLLVLMPWNLPLWWQLRRLRYAIEVDCDRRVLRSGQDVRNYGETLIIAAKRQSSYIGAVAAMSESKSFLEQRITIMMSKPVKWQRAAATTLAGLSMALLAVAAEVAPPNSEAGGANARQEVAVAAADLDRNVGSYKMGEEAVLAVTRTGSQLLAQLTGQPAIPIYPQSDSEFFYKVVDAQISFLVDAQGQVNALVLHQNGQNITMLRIDAAVAQQIAVNIAAKVHGQAPTPGSEAALRRLIAWNTAGNPDYSQMSPELAQATREQLPQIKLAMAHFGAVQSVQFRGVGNMGWDIYEVQHEHGVVQYRIALASNGIITGALMTAGP